MRGSIKGLIAYILVEDPTGNPGLAPNDPNYSPGFYIWFLNTDNVENALWKSGTTWSIDAKLALDFKTSFGSRKLEASVVDVDKSIVRLKWAPRGIRTFVDAPFPAVASAGYASKGMNAAIYYTGAMLADTSHPELKYMTPFDSATDAFSVELGSRWERNLSSVDFRVGPLALFTTWSFLEYSGVTCRR